MGITAAVAIGAGAVVSAFGQKQANDAASAAERRNAAILGQQAQLQREEAEQEAAIFGEQADIALGDTVSSYAKSGVSISSGSAILLTALQQSKAANDKQSILISGRKRADITDQEANNRRRNARAINRGTGLQVAGTLLGGIGGAAAQFPTKST